MGEYLFALACDPDGTYALTVYEGEKSATVELSTEQAADLASMLTNGTYHGNDLDNDAALKSPPAVLTQEDLHGLNPFASAQSSIGTDIKSDAPGGVLD